eukprot:9838604-Lingulodinium_polyedra.AAC.1
MASKPAGKHVRVRTKRYSPKVREPTPDYGVSRLQEELLKFVRITGVRAAFDLGVYSKVLLGQAVRGQALAACAPLLRTLVSVADHAMIKHKDLKQVLVNVGLYFDGLVPAAQSLD